MDRLLRAGIDADIVGSVAEDLERVGLIDDRAFARDLVASRTLRRLEGSRAVRAALRAGGVPDDIAEDALADARGDEGSRANELAERRAPRLRTLPPEAAYGRLVSFLQRRGHAWSTASTAARRALAIDDPD